MNTICEHTVEFVPKTASAICEIVDLLEDDSPDHLLERFA